MQRPNTLRQAPLASAAANGQEGARQNKATAIEEENNKLQDEKDAQSGEDARDGACQVVPRRTKRGGIQVQQAHAWVPAKRLRKKTGEPEAKGFAEEAWQLGTPSTDNMDGDMFYLRCLSSGRDDPRKVKERQIEVLSKKLNQKPTLPLQYQHLCSAREAYDLASWHCSFCGCGYATESEQELEAHISGSHAAVFGEVCGPDIKEQDMLGMYAAAITKQCQSAAPAANVSIDRRSLRSYQKSLEADNISCLLCFVCARKYPYVRSCSNQDVGWVQPVDAKKKISLASL